MTDQDDGRPWYCLYCRNEVPDGEQCMNPTCADARVRAQRRMGLGRPEEVDRFRIEYKSKGN